MDPVELLVHVASEIKQIGEPAERAAVERWLLEYAAVNVDFNVSQAMIVAEQLARRFGTATIRDERAWEHLCRLPLRTALEWSLEGIFPTPSARAVTAPGSHGDELELFLPEDVPEAEVGELLPWVAHRKVGPPEFTEPDFAEFAGCVGKREQAMFAKLLEVHALVRWDFELPDDVDYYLDYEDPEEFAFTQTEGEEIHIHLNLNPEAAGRGVMMMVLSMVTELAIFYALGAFDDPDEEQLDIDAFVSPLELELTTWLAARRLRQHVHPGPVAADWLTSPETPAPDDLRWALVFDVAGVVEGMMLGHRHQVND